LVRIKIANPVRRRLLGGGVAASSLFLPLPYAWVWAQSEGAMKLLRLPKIALVVGNSSYKEAPLKNPANDAKAIGDALKGAGFDVLR
jgi:Caspase domain